MEVKKVQKEIKLTAQQRAMYFSARTRQHQHTLPTQTTTSANSTLQFTLPKNRFLSKISIMVTATLNFKHASKTQVPFMDMGVYNIVRRISVDLNNGFTPYSCGARECAMLNLISQNSDKIKESQNPDTLCSSGTLDINGASDTGIDNEVSFLLELPITLNQRDTTGLVLLQNEQTTVNLIVDVGNANDILAEDDKTGFTGLIKSLTVTPVLETFSIPSEEMAYPDLSVIKLVDSRSETFTGSGLNIVSLPTGYIYRKLLLFIQDTNGNGLAPSSLVGDIELCFNSADFPYRVAPQFLRYQSIKNLGITPIEGLYIFDFTYQGLPNLGGSRDLIDTEKLTQFDVRFNSKVSGKISVISEKLSRLM